MMNYKKIAAALFTLALLPLSAAPMFCKAYFNYTETLNIDDWVCRKTTTDTEIKYYITGYTGDSDEIVIPDMIEDQPISGVTFRSDFCDHEIHSVVFPKTYNIHFYPPDPYAIKKIEFTSDQVELGTISLTKTGITELVLPTVVGHNENMIKNCPDLKRVEFAGGNGELELGIGYFDGCTSLEEAVFGDGYSKITLNGNIFKDSVLKRVEINSPCSITTKAFSNCSQLTEVKFSKYVDTKKGIFKESPLLENIMIEDPDENMTLDFLDGCANLVNFNSEPAFDSETGEFNEKYRDFMNEKFVVLDDVGFVNEYVMWHVKDIIKNIITDDMSDMEKVKAIYQYVCQNVEYDHTFEHMMSDHNDIAPFMTGITICDGYARAVDLLLHEAGIESCCVTSDDHIWNIINLGGTYFHIDATWDDIGDAASYNWFLRSDEEMRSEGGSHAFWGLKNVSSIHGAKPENVPVCKSPMGDANSDGNISAADLVDLSQYLLNGTKKHNEDILCDLDLSGEVDVFDLVLLRKKFCE